VYSLLFILFVYLLNKKIKHGPIEEYSTELIEESSRRNNPIIKQQSQPS